MITRGLRGRAFDAVRRSEQRTCESLLSQAQSLELPLRAVRRPRENGRQVIARRRPPASMIAKYPTRSPGISCFGADLSFDIQPWDSDAVKDALEKRGLRARIGTGDIHEAAYRSFTPGRSSKRDVRLGRVTSKADRVTRPIGWPPARPWYVFPIIGAGTERRGPPPAARDTAKWRLGRPTVSYREAHLN
jgi:hypothetical protein